MEIKPITDRQEWNTFFEAAGSPSFHQSWEWGEVQKELSYDILRLGLYDGGALHAIALVVKVYSKRGHFLFIPHGPLFHLPSKTLAMEIAENKIVDIKKQLQQFTEYLTAIARQEKFCFIRIAPAFSENDFHKTLFKDLGYRTAPIYMHAERMEVLSLNNDDGSAKNDEALLSHMRKTTRYSIKRSERDGVTIETRNDEQAIDDFWSIYEQTAERESFTPFSKKYITDEFNAFNKTNNAVFLFAKHTDPETKKEQYLAGALIIFTKSAGFYHQGASVHSKVPAPYLLQWHAIKLAQSRGCSHYNFWGIVRAGRTPKSWSGLTLFKQGFGGSPLDYLFTQDYVITPKYALSYLYERYLNWRRGV